MKPPSNGITPDVIRDAMPPYELSTDLLEAIFDAIPAPPPHTSMAWRQTRAARLVQEVAGLMPADVPQARIAAAIVIARETADGTFAHSNAPGLPVGELCRLQRTAGALGTYALALERALARHQQMPAPFFGTVLAEGIDVAALATRWGVPGSRRDGGEAGGDGSAPVRMAEPAPSVTVERGPDVTVTASTPVTTEPGRNATEAPGGVGLADSPVRVEMAGSTPGTSAGGQELPAMPVNSGPTMTEDSGPAMTTNSGLAATQTAEARPGVVSRLDQGPGWTLDVVRPRTEGDGMRPRTEGDGMRPCTEGDGMRPRTEGDGMRPSAESDVVCPRTESDVMPPRTESDVVRPFAERDVVRPRMGGGEAVNAAPEFVG